MVRNPVISHAPINNAGEPTSREISAETRKIPDPIIEPITSMVELVRPRPLTNSRSDVLVVSTVGGFVSTLNYPPAPILCSQDALVWDGQVKAPAPTPFSPNRLYSRMRKNSSDDLP